MEDGSIVRALFDLGDILVPIQESSFWNIRAGYYRSTRQWVNRRIIFTSMIIY